MMGELFLALAAVAGSFWMAKIWLSPVNPARPRQSPSKKPVAHVVTSQVMKPGDLLVVPGKGMPDSWTFHLISSGFLACK